MRPSSSQLFSVLVGILAARVSIFVFSWLRDQDIPPLTLIVTAFTLFELM